jgi:hypothetical protein
MRVFTPQPYNPYETKLYDYNPEYIEYLKECQLKEYEQFKTECLTNEYICVDNIIVKNNYDDTYSFHDDGYWEAFLDSKDIDITKLSFDDVLSIKSIISSRQNSNVNNLISKSKPISHYNVLYNNTLSDLPGKWVSINFNYQNNGMTYYIYINDANKLNNINKLNLNKYYGDCFYISMADSIKNINLLNPTYRIITQPILGIDKNIIDYHLNVIEVIDCDMRIDTRSKELDKLFDEYLSEDVTESKLSNDNYHTLLLTISATIIFIIWIAVYYTILF